jgi:hypothetical protein
MPGNEIGTGERKKIILDSIGIMNEFPLLLHGNMFNDVPPACQHIKLKINFASQ